MMLICSLDVSFTPMTHWPSIRLGTSWAKVSTSQVLSKSPKWWPRYSKGSNIFKAGIKAVPEQDSEEKTAEWLEKESVKCKGPWFVRSPKDIGLIEKEFSDFKEHPAKTIILDAFHSKTNLKSMVDHNGLLRCYEKVRTIYRTRKQKQRWWCSKEKAWYCKESSWPCGWSGVSRKVLDERSGKHKNKKGNRGTRLTKTSKSWQHDPMIPSGDCYSNVWDLSGKKHELA